MVGAWCLQDLLEWSFGGLALGGLLSGRVALRSTAATRLSSPRRLLFFFFLSKHKDDPSPWSTNCLPLALRVVEGRRDRLLIVRVIGHDVEEFPSSSGGPTLQSVDESGAGRAVLEC
jgi:hypothetical protein